MRRILAQTRKELTQIMRDRMALGLALVLPLMQLILMGSAISLTVERSADRGAGSRRFARFAQLDRCFPAVEYLPRRAVPGRPAARNRVHVEQGPRRADHPGALRARHRARRQLAGADADRRLRFQHREAAVGLRGRSHRAWNADNGGGGAGRAGAGRDSLLVQPRPLVEEILRAGNLRAGAVAVSAAAGHAGHGEGRRAEDHPAGLRLQHFGA